MNKLLVSFAISSLALLCSGCGDEITNINGPADWQGPTVEWASPIDAEVRGTIGLDVAVRDSSSIIRVKLYLDGREDQTLTVLPYRFTVVTDSLADGVHLCETRAWDQYENLGISPVLRVNVANSIAQGPRVLWVPDSFATIQAAINAATDYDTIRVRDGVYYETLNLFGKGIWIESEHGPLRCTLDAQGAHNATFTSTGSAPATIRGLRVVGGSFVLSEFEDGAQFLFCNNIVVSDTAAALLHASRTGGHILNNLFVGAQECVMIWALLGTVRNNILEEARTAGLWNSNYGTNPVVHRYNLYWRNTQDYAFFEPGEGDIHADPLIDLLHGGLLEGSPCIDGGDPDLLDHDGSRSDIGPFGGLYAY